MREAARFQQVKDVYGGAEPTKTSEVSRLRARIEELEKENRMLKLRLQPPDKQAAQKAGSAAQAAAAAPRAAKGSGADLWSLEAWLRSVPTAKIMSGALIKHLKKASPAGAVGDGLEQAFMDELGSSGDLPTFKALLHDALVLEEIADALFASAKKLAKQKAAARKAAIRKAQGSSQEVPEDEDSRVAAFRAKFVDDGARELVMGTLDTFFGQLHGLVGLPAATTLPALRVEHCERADADVTFEVGNYGTSTTSAQEFCFVASATPAPTETRNVYEVGTDVDRRRQPRPVKSYAAARAQADAKLALLGVASVSDAEFVAARLYTGPMYLKYNTTLRAVPGKDVALAKVFERLCCGNRYEATIHLISAAIAKLGRIQKAQPLYRAPGGVVPADFWRYSEYNVRGGVEYAFMSATAEREVALEYAQDSAAGVIFEIHQAMVDRGAELSWLSQYPHEKEVTFPPLTALEVRDSHVEGSIIVVEMTPRLVDEYERPPPMTKSSVCAVM